MGEAEPRPGRAGDLAVVELLLGLARHRNIDQGLAHHGHRFPTPRRLSPAAAGDEAGTSPGSASIPLTAWRNNPGRAARRSRLRMGDGRAQEWHRSELRAVELSRAVGLVRGSSRRELEVRVPCGRADPAHRMSMHESHGLAWTRNPDRASADLRPRPRGVRAPLRQRQPAAVGSLAASRCRSSIPVKTATIA
jgi:hypothetical protein